MDGRPTWTDCDVAGDYVVPNVLSPRNLVSRPDITDETVPNTDKRKQIFGICRLGLRLVCSASYRLVCFDWHDDAKNATHCKDEATCH